MCRQKDLVKQGKKKVSLIFGVPARPGCGLNSPKISKLKKIRPLRNIYLKFFFCGFLANIEHAGICGGKLQLARQFVGVCQSKGVDLRAPKYLRLTPQDH